LDAGRRAEGGEGVIILAPLEVLLLDPSYEATGFALLDGRANIIDKGVFRCVNEQLDQRRRGNEIAYRIGQYVSTRPGLTHIGMEVPYARGRVFVGESLNRLNGAIGAKLYDHRPDIYIQDMKVDEWRDKIGFSLKKLALSRKDPRRTEKIKGALLDLARARWPGMPFHTPDEAEACLMGIRYLMAIHGTLPFEVKRRTKSGGRGLSSTSASSKSSAPSTACSGARPSRTQRRSGSKTTAKSLKQQGG
jgi:hypothetical protein